MDEGGGFSEWRPLAVPAGTDCQRLQLRLLAAHDPVGLGEPFVARLRDTWVQSRPPEHQELHFGFVSPSGREHRARAEYLGDYRWQVEFVPDELGRWSYRWVHEFDRGPRWRAPGTFDVLPKDPAAVLAALRALRSQLEDADVDSLRDQLRALDPVQVIGADRQMEPVLLE